MFSMNASNSIRPAAVAGMFYPAGAYELAHEIDTLLGGVAPVALDPLKIKAIAVPHAGYVYSGETAASAYALIAARRDSIRRVVLLGPTHRVAVQGLALPDADGFASPLGTVALDAELVAAARTLPQVVVSRTAHAAEHSLEVQLPFLQRVLDSFTLLPLAVGRANAEEVAEVLDTLWGGAETLIVVSTDLSHFHAYDEAVQIDSTTVRDVLALHTDIDHEHACGATPLNGLLLCAQRRGLAPHLIDARNSGDTAGDRSRVVGYAAFAFTEQTDSNVRTSSSSEIGPVVLARARLAIARHLGLPDTVVPDHASLSETGASFVTLNRQGHLRGCIGTLAARRPLRDDVDHNAVAAAFRDPRFPPLSAEEFGDLEIEVSLLSEPERMSFRDEADALAQLRPGIDGVILASGPHQATFLPQVWESLPDPRNFMTQLKRKAGVVDDFWSPDLTLARYQVRKFTESSDG